MTDIARSLNSICESVPYAVRYSILNARDGVVFERREREETPSASTRKISIMLAALNAVCEGRLDLDSHILYEPRLRDGVSVTP